MEDEKKRGTKRRADDLPDAAPWQVRKALKSAAHQERKKKTNTIKFKTRSLKPKRFDFRDEASFEAARKHFDDEGYVVFAGAATAEEAVECERLLMQWLNEASEGRITTDPKTWVNENWPDIQQIGMIAYDGIGQSDAAHKARTLPGIIEIWQKWHRTRRLVSSYDSIRAIRGAEHKKVKPFRDWVSDILSRASRDWLFTGSYRSAPGASARHGTILARPSQHEDLPRPGRSRLVWLLSQDAQGLDAELQGGQRGLV